MFRNRGVALYKAKMMPTTFDLDDNLLDNEKAAIDCLFVLSLSIVAHLSQCYPECTLNLNLLLFSCTRTYKIK